MEIKYKLLPSVMAESRNPTDCLIYFLLFFALLGPSQLLEEFTQELNLLPLVLWLVRLSNQLTWVQILWIIPLSCLSGAVFTDV